MRFAKFGSADGDVLIEIDADKESIDLEHHAGRFRTSRSDDAEMAENAATRLVDAMKGAISPNAAAILAACRDAAVNPDEIEVTFGLKAAIEGGVAFFGIAKASAEANYTVRMKWKKTP